MIHGCDKQSAVRNSLLEAESRLALAILGLDPGLGFLHQDTPNRDSLASDLMEPLRAQVDVFLVRWLITETLKREWFIEQSDGACRLTGTFTAYLSETAPWARAVAPTAEWISNTLWSGIRKRNSEPALATRPNRDESQARGNEYVSAIEPQTYPPNVCRGCGASTKRGRTCTKCGREISREKLIEIAKLGRIFGHSLESRKKQSATQRRHELAKREWRSMPKPSWPTEQIYIDEIQPPLSTITIAKTLAACSVLGIRRQEQVTEVWRPSNQCASKFSTPSSHSKIIPISAAAMMPTIQSPSGVVNLWTAFFRPLSGE